VVGLQWYPCCRLQPATRICNTWMNVLGSHSFVLKRPEDGTAVAQWLRCCATNRKVAGSIPDGVTGIFH